MCTIEVEVGLELRAFGRERERERERGRGREREGEGGREGARERLGLTFSAAHTQLECLLVDGGFVHGENW